MNIRKIFVIIGINALIGFGMYLVSTDLFRSYAISTLLYYVLLMYRYLRGRARI